MGTFKTSWPYFLTFFLLGGLITFLVMNKWSCNPPQPSYGDKDLFPDTVRIIVNPNPYIDTSGKDYTKPVYPNPQTDYDKPLDKDKHPHNDNWVIGDDSGGVYIPGSRIDTLPYITGSRIDTPSLKVHRDFLSFYPTNPKLIKAYIKKQNLDLHFLTTGGKIRTVSFKTDLDRYDYLWENGSFSAKEKPPLSTPPNIKMPKVQFESFLTATANPILKSVRIQIDGTISWGKIGITGYSSYNTAFNPALDIGAGIRYRLTK